MANSAHSSRIGLNSINGTVLSPLKWTYSDFQVNEPHLFYLTQSRRDAKEEIKKQECGLNT
jgi:hypothetical protein